MANERYYKIKVIALSLKNNRIGKANEVISERLLSSAPLELIEQGFIEEVLPKENKQPEPEVKYEAPKGHVEEKKAPAKAKKTVKSEKK